MIRVRLASLFALSALFALTVSVSAQAAQRGARGRGAAAAAAAGDAIAPAEIQRMFDAYALLQAQTQLQISDDEYPRFLARFKALQDVRRKSLQEHTRLVVELRRLLMQGQGDDAQLKERIQAMQDLDTRSAADIRRAYDAIDQVLDVRQQAKFRVFEELMERRKLELVTRARQANRQRQQP
jgi:hypothetical protein